MPPPLTRHLPAHPQLLPDGEAPLSEERVPHAGMDDDKHILEALHGLPEFHVTLQ